MQAIGLLPHRPPMLFVESLLERYGNTAIASAILAETGNCYQPGGVLPEFFVEVIAQTVAMASGYDALCRGERMNEGMLVGIDSFSFTHADPHGRRLSVETEKVFEFGAVKIIHGKVFCGNVLLAEGDIKVWEKLEQDGNG